MAAEDWGREGNLYRKGGRRSKIRRGVGVGKWRFSPFARPLHPPSTLTPNQTAGRINDCELLTLARTSKTPVLQARWLALRVELWDWGRSKRHSFQGSGRCTSRRVTVCLVAGYFLFFFLRCGKGGEACEHSESSQKGLHWKWEPEPSRTTRTLTSRASQLVS